MKFNKINKLILFGGGRLLNRFAQHIAERQEMGQVVFSAKRHLQEKLAEDNLTLRDALEKNNILFYDSDDINKDPNLKKQAGENTLGIALGAAWVFEQETVNLFAKNHLLDFMGIDLPRYRGGAHYTWQLLHQNKKGCVNLQIIHGGKETLHKGEIIKRKEYQLPPELKKPIDYFNFSGSQELTFLKEFLVEIGQGTEFELKALNEKESSLYPCLASKLNGLINWAWSGKEIELFIDAFDEPYSGASTYLSGKKVFLKDCELLPSQEKYHPFTSGIIIRKNEQGIFTAVVGGLLRIKTVLDQDDKNIIDSVELGDRLYTLLAELEKAMTFKALYDAKGLQSFKNNE